MIDVISLKNQNKNIFSLDRKSSELTETSVFEKCSFRNHTGTTTISSVEEILWPAIRYYSFIDFIVFTDINTVSMWFDLFRNTKLNESYECRMFSR